MNASKNTVITIKRKEGFVDYAAECSVSGQVSAITLKEGLYIST